MPFPKAQIVIGCSLFQAGARPDSPLGRWGTLFSGQIHSFCIAGKRAIHKSAMLFKKKTKRERERDGYLRLNNTLFKRLGEIMTASCHAQSHEVSSNATNNPEQPHPSHGTVKRTPVPRQWGSAQLALLRVQSPFPSRDSPPPPIPL